MKKILLLPLLAVALASPIYAEEPADAHLFELRTYHASPGKLEALLKRFSDHTTALFEKHGMTNVAYWVPVDNKDELLVYLLSYPNREARDASWKSFSADPEWNKARTASETDGKLAMKVDQLFLSPTDYSSPFSIEPEGGAARLFEMRTYTASEGNLEALHARFRDHTTKLFSKHGMTNLGYFTLAEGQPGADRTLLYFLAHQDQNSAEESFKAFRADPAWTAARTASEEAAGGSLTVPNGVKSLFLEATDFSPVR